MGPDEVQIHKVDFANWDTSAPDLKNYLGISHYLDGVLDRREGGTEIVGGVKRSL
ncbi:hypothetical protein P4S64_13490 [Vibrio sp. M60_M31a]